MTPDELEALAEADCSPAILQHALLKAAGRIRELEADAALYKGAADFRSGRIEKLEALILELRDRVAALEPVRKDEQGETLRWSGVVVATLKPGTSVRPDYDGYWLLHPDDPPRLLTWAEMATAAAKET